MMMNSSNNSDHLEGTVQHVQIPWTLWLRGVFAVVTVLGNLLIILLILTRPPLRTTQNCYLLSLAVADFLVGAVTFPLVLISMYLYRIEDYGVYMYFALATYDFCLYASTINLCALTLDRYICIVHPLKRNFSRKKSNAVKLLSFSWFAAVLLPFTLFFLRIFSHSPEAVWRYSVFLLCFVSLPCLFLPVAFFRVLCVVNHQRARIERQRYELQHNYSVNRYEKEQCEKNKRSVNVLGGVIGFFVITNILQIVNAWQHLLGIPSFGSTLSRVSLILLNANSMNNVFVYGILKKDFREEIAKVFCRRNRAARVGSELATRSCRPSSKRTTDM